MSSSSPLSSVVPRSFFRQFIIDISIERVKDTQWHLPHHHHHDNTHYYYLYYVVQ
jgi:hypothetical protein